MNTNNKRPIKERQQRMMYNRKYFGRGIFFIVLIVFIVFIGRFFRVAVGHKIYGVDLNKSTQQLYASKTEIKAKRGTIYDAANQPIAEDTTTYSIYIVLSKSAVAYGKKEYLPDSQKKKAAKVLSDNLNISYKRVLQILNPKDKNTYQVELGNVGKNISLETKKKIDSYHLTGIKFTPSQSRLYPNGVFASHLIGLAESEDKKLVGIMGLEKVFNKQLSGRDGINNTATDSYGVQLPGSSKKKRSVQNGDDIYTTLDPKIQTALENLLTQKQKKFKAASINAVVMDSHTGKIVAASQRPTFDAQTKEGLTNVWRNTLLEDAYEPGSTMKVLTVASAINSGNYDSNATYRSGSYVIDGSTVYDWNRSGWGNITVKEGFMRSSNAVMAQLEQKMGKKTWMSYIRKFGLLRPVGAGLGAESSGNINYTYTFDQANTAYGQGIDITVIQMMQAFSAIANKGKMVKPRLVDKIVDPNTGKTVYKSKTQVVGKPITAKTSKKVLDMMEAVVYDEKGLGQDYAIDGYKIAAKTGTAQIANSNGTGYLSGSSNYIFSVVGMAPADNPRYIMYLTVKQPKSFGNNDATKNLSTIFNPIMKKVLDSSQVNNTNPGTVKVENVVGNSVDDAKDKISKQGLVPVVVGSGDKVEKQSVEGDQTVISGEKVLLLTNGTKTMPDINGWSRNDIAKLADLTGITVNYTGSGYAYYQSIAAGGALKKSDIVEVKLK